MDFQSLRTEAIQASEQLGPMAWGTPTPNPGPVWRFINAASPSIIIALCERLEAAESVYKTAAHTALILKRWDDCKENDPPCHYCLLINALAKWEEMKSQ